MRVTIVTDTQDRVFREGAKVIFHCVMEPSAAVEILQPFLYWKLGRDVYFMSRSYLNISELSDGHFISSCWSSSLRMPAFRTFYVVG